MQLPQQQQSYGTSFDGARLKAIIATLGTGETCAGLRCPACLGGNGEEDSFSVTRMPHMAVFFCHRNSCGFKGRIPIGAIDREEDDGVSYEVRKPIPKLPVMEDIGEYVYTHLESKYFLDRKTVDGAGWRWGDERLWMPIRDRWNTIVGWSGRSLDKRVRPKNRIVKTDENALTLSWYDSRENIFNDVLVIVEDQISALRMSKFCMCVALLGTHLSEDKVVDILKKAAHCSVYVALDNDAQSTIARAIAKYSPLFNEFKALMLTKDIKDMTDKEIVELWA
jgi:hypothetical protein